MVKLTPTSLASRTPNASTTSAKSRSSDENRAYQVVAKAQKEAGAIATPTSTVLTTRALSVPSGRSLDTESPKRRRSVLGEVDPNVARQSPSQKSGNSDANNVDNGTVSLSKCLPEDILRLKHGDNVYIMCSSSSEAFRQTCDRLAFENRLSENNESVDAIDEYRMPRADYDKVKDDLYCFPGIVEVACEYSSGTAVGPYIREQLEMASSQCLSVLLEPCVSALPVPWNMVLELSIEVWIPHEVRGGKSHDFLLALGRDPRDVSMLLRPVERLLGEAKGDPVQTLQITSAFYQKKARILMHKLKKFEEDNKALKAALVDPNGKIMNDAIAVESEKAVAFVKVVDGLFLRMIQEHFGGWHYVKSSLLPVSYFHEVFQQMEQSFPRLYSTIKAFVFSERDCKPNSQGSTRLYLKQLRVLDMFMAMARTRSQFNGFHYSLCETLSQIGRGVKRVDMQGLVRRRVAVTMPCAFNFLRQMSKQARASLTQVLASERSLCISLDNHQQIKSVKAQRNGTSTTSVEGTVRFARKNFAVPPTPGSRVRYFSNPPVEYIVDSVSPILDNQDRRGYFYKVIVREVNNIQNFAIIPQWPNPLYRIVRFVGAESVSLDFVDQVVPASPFMLKPRGMKWPDVVFSTIPGIFDSARTSNPGLYEPLTTSEYAKVARRSITLGKLRRNLSIPPKAKERRKSIENGDNDADGTTTSPAPAPPTGNEAVQDDADEATAQVEVDLIDGGDASMESEENTNENAGGGVSMENDTNDNASGTGTCDADEAPEDIFWKLRPKLLLGKQFLDRYVKSYNWTSDELALLILMEMSKHEELSTEGMVKVMIEFLMDLGRLSRDDSGNLTAMPGIELTRLILYGDGLTNMRIRSIIARVKEKRAELGKEEYVANLLKALDTLLEMPGDLHIPFHMLQALFRGFYGGGIQVAQAILGYSRIQYDPVPRYQASQRLVVMMYEMLESVRLDEWKAGLARDRSGGALLSLPSGVTFVDGADTFTEVTLSDLNSFDEEDAAGILASSYEAYSDKLLQSPDEVVRYWAEFHQMAESFVLYELSVRRGDSIMVELLAVKWLLYFKATGKTNYVETFLSMMETLYDDIGAYELEEVRWNRFIRLNKGRRMVAMDEFCEIMNDWSKEMSNSDDIDSLAEKSLFLSLFRRCMHMSDLLAGMETTPSSSKPSRMANDRKALYDMFSELKVCTEQEGRVLPDDGAWSVFAKVKLQVEQNKNSSLYDEEYQKKLMELFGTLSSKESEVPEEGEGESMSVDVEENDDDAGEVDDPEEATAAMQRMKKYTTEKMALKGLLKSGTAALENIKEDREEKRNREKHEDDIVAEAVREFVEEQAPTTNDDSSQKSSMSWEEDWIEGTS